MGLRLFPDPDGWGRERAKVDDLLAIRMCRVSCLLGPTVDGRGREDDQVTASGGGGWVVDDVRFPFWEGGRECWEMSTPGAGMVVLEALSLLGSHW